MHILRQQKPDSFKNENGTVVMETDKGQTVIAEKVLIATGQLIGEGFDCKELSSLFLATPIRFDGRVIQYLGRVLRPAPGKEKPKVYDYVDSRVAVLRASGLARQRIYRGEVGKNE